MRISDWSSDVCSSDLLVCDIRSAFRTGEELPLGTPISSEVRALVLDAHGKPVAPGETGILHVAGSPLFSSYFRDPALTASAFVVIPGIDAQLFNSHDQVRLHEGGAFTFVELGRASCRERVCQYV